MEGKYGGGGNGYGAIKKGRIGGEQKVNGMSVIRRLRRALLRELELREGSCKKGTVGE